MHEGINHVSHVCYFLWISLSFENIGDIIGAIIFTYQFSSIGQLRIYHVSLCYKLPFRVWRKYQSASIFYSKPRPSSFSRTRPPSRFFWYLSSLSAIVHLYRDLQDISSCGRKEYNELLGEIPVLDRS